MSLKTAVGGGVCISLFIAILSFKIVANATLGSFGAGGVGGVFSNQCGSDNVCTPQNFGAKADDSTDDWPALEAAYIAAYNVGGPLFIPAATYRVKEPLLFTNWNQTNLTGYAPVPVYGADWNRTILDFGNVALPGIVLTPPDYTTALGTISTSPIVGATANAAQWNSGKPWFMRFNELPIRSGSGARLQPLNGLSALTIQFFFQTTASSGAHPIMASIPAGTVNAGSGAIDISYTVGGAFQAIINTGGSETTLSGGTVAQNTVYWGALVLCPSSCNDAGENAYLYLAAPGATSQSPVAKHSVSGNVTQAVNETWAIGMRMTFPPKASDGTQHVGQLQSVDVETTNLYTGAAVTAPNANFSKGGSTIYLQNFTQIAGNQTVGGTTVNNVPWMTVDACGGCSGGGGNYQMIWNQTYDGNGQSVNLENLQVKAASMGYFVAEQSGSYFRRVRAANYETVGFEPFNNTFNSHWVDVYATSVGGFVYSDIECSSFVGSIDFASTGSGAYAIAGLCGLLNHPIVSAGTSVIAAIYLTGDFDDFTDSYVFDPEIDNELGAGSSAYGIEVATCTNGIATGVTTISGGTIIAGGAAAAIRIDNPSSGCANTIIDGGASLWSNSGNAIDFSTTNPTTPPIVRAIGIQNNAPGALSNKPQWIIQGSCGGTQALSGGSGMLSNPCIVSSSICQAIDTTNSANTCTLAAPGTGSIAITGTSSDVCKVACQ